MEPYKSTKDIMSNNGIKRKIVIPKKLSSELAEIIGIAIGDGHVRIGNDG